MSLTARVAAHLPFLRRYSRAVTGSQTSGDAYVVATLEALIADIGIFPTASSDRVALYKLLVTIQKIHQQPKAMRRAIGFISQDAYAAGVCDQSDLVTWLHLCSPRGHILVHQSEPRRIVVTVGFSCTRMS